MKKFIYGKNDYGFFDKIDSYNIRKTKKIDIDYYQWVVTSQFNSAKNHCAATTSANLDIYFSKLNYLSKDELFNKHHKIIGNGPVLGFSSKTKNILIESNIHLDSKRYFFNKIKKIKQIIDKENIGVLLLKESLLNWHWIICVGYIETEDDKTILMIIDNWNKFIRYYIAGKGSKLFSVYEFKKLY